MGLLDEAAASTDQADLILLSHVETLREQYEPVTASTVASLIGGAPQQIILSRLHRLTQLGLLEPMPGRTTMFALSAMGAEFLCRELVGWSPSLREQRRRDAKLLSAVTGAYRRP